MRSWMTASIVFVLAASYAGAQTVAPAEGAKKEVIATGGVISSLVAAPVMGQPYSAIQTQHRSRKLTDGTTIEHREHHFVARDSAGRVRVEMSLIKGENGGPDTVMVFVSDPVAHTVTTWMSGPQVNKVASVAKIPPERKQEAVVAQPKTASGSTRPQPVITTEDLGMQTLNGLQVSDIRTTTVVPAGRSGNDAPITKTHEVWTSDEMKLVLKSQWEDPRSGERTVELENFSRTEPDTTLFHAPRGYTVKGALESLKELEEKLNATQD